MRLFSLRRKSMEIAKIVANLSLLQDLRLFLTRLYVKSVQKHLKLKNKYIPFFFAILLALLDLLTKFLIRNNNIQEYVVFEGILTIDLTYNTGIAFGLFSDYTIFTYILSLFVFIWLIVQIKDIRERSLELYSLVLILSGAVGNLGERGWNLITNNDGKVTDFVELLFIPSFNLADTYISIGIVLLFYSEIKKD